jgi:hypothetical protein
MKYCQELDYACLQGVTEDFPKRGKSTEKSLRRSGGWNELVGLDPGR